jgi:uncharacterized membrane protein YphA (DoxX/SURF4 family)
MNSLFTKIIRIVLAIVLILFGLNKLMPSPFIPLPELPEKAGQFMTSLANTGYVLKTVGVLEVLIGVLLLLKKWVAFALILLAPISINILLFHLFLDIPGLSMALIIVVFNVVLIYKHWPQYKPLFY